MAVKNKEEEQKKPRRRVKKVKHHGGHHGGAWKVAYADFVTAMMALFLVLWLVSQADTKLKQAIASYFRSPGVFDTMRGGILSGAQKVSKEPSSLTSKDEEQALFSVAESLKKKFDTRPEFSKFKDRVKVQVTEEGMKIQLLDEAERVSFPVGSAEVSPEAREVLIEIARSICSLPNPITIGGHTDSRVFPSNTGYTNWELSADRANAARRILQGECVPKQQIRRITGYADSELFVPEDPYAPANRRISITVLRTIVSDLQSEAGQNPDAENSDLKDSGLKRSETGKTNSAQKPLTPNSKEKPNPETEAEKSPNALKPETKLAKEGSVTIGEADKVPSVPKTSEQSKDRQK